VRLGDGWWLGIGRVRLPLPPPPPPPGAPHPLPPLLTWQVPKSGLSSGAKPVNKDRFISKMFLRGDSVILVLRNPK
jgi:hypothetical protein